MRVYMYGYMCFEKAFLALTIRLKPELQPLEVLDINMLVRLKRCIG